MNKTSSFCETDFCDYFPEQLFIIAWIPVILKESWGKK